MNYHYMHINYLLNKYNRRFKEMKTKYYDLKIIFKIETFLKLYVYIFNPIVNQLYLTKK